MIEETKDALESEVAEAQEGLLRVQVSILSQVLEKPKRLIKIAKKLKEEPCSIGRWAAEMEGLGLVKIEIDRRDKRAKLVTITPSGQAAHRLWLPF